jgi:hypothetical protein
MSWFKAHAKGHTHCVQFILVLECHGNVKCNPVICSTDSSPTRWIARSRTPPHDLVRTRYAMVSISSYRSAYCSGRCGLKACRQTRAISTGTNWFPPVAKDLQYDRETDGSSHPDNKTHRYLRVILPLRISTRFTTKINLTAHNIDCFLLKWNCRNSLHVEIAKKTVMRSSTY